MIVYTGGSFEIVHAGHVNFFRKVKKLFPDSHLVVSLNTDEFIERYKGKKPLFPFDERVQQLYMTGYVDNVIANLGDEDSKPAILSTSPDVIVIGNDWLEKNYCAQMSFSSQWLRDKSITLCFLPYTEGISTTEIKKRLINA